MRSLALAFALAFALAGCLAPAVSPASGGAVASIAASAVFGPVNVSTSTPGGEPVIAVTSDGTLFAQGIGTTPNGNLNSIWRSQDKGASWTDITPPQLGKERSNDGFVAVGNGDSVYAANVYQTTLQMFRSDDKGKTWKQLNVPHVPLLMHRHWIVTSGDRMVHLAIEAFPPGFATYLARLPNIEQAQGTPNEGMWYLSSPDKGETWTVPKQIDPKVNFVGQSQLVMSKDGQHLYVGRYADSKGAFNPTYTSGHFYLLASDDAGKTWQRREMFDLTGELSTAVTPLALDDAGKLSFVWTQASSGQSRLRMSTSTDGGKTWTPAAPVGPQTGTQAMAFATSPGPAGTVDILWYEADANGTASKVNASWFVRFARVTPNGTSVAALTPTAVHEGNICARGPACGTGEDRRLLDYPWIAYSPDGTANTIFPSTKWEKPSSFAVFARVGV